MLKRAKGRPKKTAEVYRDNETGIRYYWEDEPIEYYSSPQMAKIRTGHRESKSDD